MVFLFLLSGVHSQILINEIMPANSSDFLDPTNNYGGWVEFYNPGETSQSLGGYYLSDNPDQPEKYCIPGSNAVVPAKGYLVYWFDHTDLLETQANFKLDCAGGELTLYDPYGKTVTSLYFPEQILHTSYARVTDGTDEWQICTPPTPGSSNAGSMYYFERCPEPEFTMKGGIYRSSVTVQVSCPSDMEIRYTTDGSEPSEKSPLWSRSKQFSETTILRARVMADGYIPGSVITQSYILSDREMTLPVVSIVTDPKNLWDDEIGIYCEGTNGVPGNCMDRPVNWNRDWARPANMEILNGPQQVFSQECDISIGGRCSRRWPLKTLQLNAEKKYDGRNHFLYPFFKAKPGLRYKSLSLRNSGDDCQGTMMKDAVQQSIIEGVLDLEHQAYQPTVHYINGEYHGIINLRERNNHHYVYANFGYDKDSIDLLATGGFVLNGSNTAFEELVSRSDDATDPSVYGEISEKADLDELITYMITEMYVGNWDWPSNNIKLFRHQNNGKWRWILFDLDGGFDNMNANPFEGDGANITTCKDEKTIKFFNNLLKNKGFKQRFIDYFTICLGSVFRPERMFLIIDSIADGVRPEISYHLQRWNSTYRFQDGIDYFKFFASNRTKILLEQMKNFFHLEDPVPLIIKSNLPHATILLNEIEIPLKSMDGCTFKGNKLKLKAIAPTGYKFERWSLVSSDGSDVSVELSPESEVTVTAWNPLNLRAEFSKREETSGIIGAPLRINEVSASNTIHMNEYYEKEDWIELYNTTDTVVSVAGLYISCNPDNPMEYRIPDTPEDLVRIPPHGYRILWADKMDALSQIHLPFKLPSEGAILQVSCFEEDAIGNHTLAWKDRLTYTPHSAVQTFGRYPDGSDSTYVLNRNTFTAANYFSLYNISRPDPVTSVDDIPWDLGEGEKEIAMYYSPLSATLTVEMQRESSFEQSLVIYDLSGRPEALYRIPAYQTRYSIGLNELPGSYYIAVLYTASGQQVTFKFVK